MAKSVPPPSPRADSESEGDDNPKLFVKDEKAMKFHLYDVSDERKEILIEKITEHGGKITKSESRADIIIVTKTAHFDTLKYKWDLEKNKWVRMSGWVERCIERGKMVFPNLQVRGMGGRAKGDKEKGVMRRKPVMPFTPEDDEHLCRYIAQKIPYKENGGRLGNKIYEELVDRWQKFGQLEWAERHPWKSWRERYKKNQERLDPIIDDFVKQDPPEQHGRGQYGLRRGANQVAQDGDEEEIEVEEEIELEMYGREDDRSATEDEEDELVEASKSKGKGKQKAAPVRMEEEEEEEEEVEEVEQGEEGDHGSQEDAASIEWEVSPTPEETQPQQSGQKRRRSSGGQSGRSQDASPAKKQKTTKGKQVKRKRVEQEFYEEEPGVQDNQYAPAEDEAEPATQAAASQKSRPRPRMVRKKGIASTAQGPASSQMTLVNPTQRRQEHQEVEVVIERTPQKPKSKSKRQAKKATPPPTDAPAPYRNTRARSRSVSVQPQEPRAVPRTRGKKLVNVREEIVVEENEEDVMAQGDETLEALSVEARLGIVQEQEEEEEGEVEDELSADDRQTEQRLAQAVDAEQEDVDFMPEGAVDPTDGSSSEGSDSMEQMEQMLEAPQAKARAPSFRGPRPPASSDRVLRSKQADTYSSEEEFPSPNTKAHELRKRDIEQRKKEPYVPPAGTKARQLRARG